MPGPVREIAGAIAIVGLAGRFPGASTVDDFWENLVRGTESLHDFDNDELLVAGVSADLLNNPNYVKRGTFIEGAELFDAAFFGMNPREAEVTDPQHRVFLECAWESLEDAGYAGDHRPASIGVYAGAGPNTYLHRHVLANPEIVESVGAYQLMLASEKDYLASRVSYKLNLRGPSLTVQTACSTSLVAVSLACDHLRQGHCDMALAGGVSLNFPAKAGYLYTEGMIFSPDGHCRPFDARANGTRGSAGAGIVVLRRLEDALRDGDHIRAIIRGNAINNDGSGKIGFSAPSVDGQAAVIALAHAMARVEPESISYIEAHGTATPLGDPIEIAALQKVFGSRTKKKQFCAIGSLKSNLGHLDAAAGIAGLIKAVLSLERRAIPPSLYFQSPNPQIDFENGPFFVNDRLRPWLTNGAPRRAGVSSFGIGGTNAHAVLEEAPAPSPIKNHRPYQLLTLSALSEPALRRASAKLARWLEFHPDVDLANVSNTLQVGRKRFPHRLAFVARTHEQAIVALTARDARTRITGVQHATERPVAFLFSGQGSQHSGMAVRLYETEPVFRRSLDECADLLKGHLGRDLREALFAPAAGAAKAHGLSGSARGEAVSTTASVGQGSRREKLDETATAQPALFAVELALARMWLAWGVVPYAMIGHSIGEYVAAHLAGVFALGDALALVAERGRLMQSMPPGEMMAVALPELQVAPLCGAGVELAAVNGPALCTVAGPTKLLQALERTLTAREVNCRIIHTSHAFHSSMMDPVLGPFRDRVSRVALHPPQTRLVSTLTGRWLTSEEATDPSYWARQLRQPVRFANGLAYLLRDGSPALLEVGPGDALCTFARQCGAVDVFTTLPHPQSIEPDSEHALATLGRLWVAGAAVNWPGFHEHETLHRVPLPTYPFERLPCVVEPPRHVRLPSKNTSPPAIRTKVEDWFYVPSWKRSATPTTLDPRREPPEGQWLVFVNDSKLSAAVTRALEAAGRSITVVNHDTRFWSDGNTYRIRPGDPADYKRLLDDLVDRGAEPDHVMHLWNVTEGMGSERSQETGLYSLIALAQAVAGQAVEKVLDVLVVADGLHSVDRGDDVIPEKATLLAAIKVIPQEMPHVQTRVIDVEVASITGSRPERLARELVLEMTIDRPARVAAYRRGERWDQVYERQTLPATAGVSLRQRGVYLITGGLGGIGLVIAGWMARQAQARLVLTTRGNFPPRDEWDRLLASRRQTDPCAQRISALIKIENAGAEVMLSTADASDEREMASVVEATHRRWGKIDGVIHAAGVPGGGVIELLTRGAVESVLAPKVRATRILEQLLEHERLDFLVLCSSINAIIGTAGAVDYSAANLFLDAFAVSKHKLRGTHVVSIAWDAWNETGMAVKLAASDSSLAARARDLEHGIDNNRGIEALKTVLATGLLEVAVIPRDLPALLTALSTAEQPADLPPHCPEKGTAAPVAAGTGSQRAILQIWQELLGVPDIGLDDNFFELGGHSLLGISVLARVRGLLGVSLPLRTLFEASTVRSLAERVDTLAWATAGAPDDGSEEGEREEIDL